MKLKHCFFLIILLVVVFLAISCTPQQQAKAPEAQTPSAGKIFKNTQIYLTSMPWFKLTPSNEHTQLRNNEAKVLYRWEGNLLEVLDWYKIQSPPPWNGNPNIRILSLDEVSALEREILNIGWSVEQAKDWGLKYSYRSSKSPPV